MNTNSRGEPDAPVYDLRTLPDEHRELPPTASAQLLKPKPGTEAPKSLVEKMKEGLLRWLAPKK